MNATELKEKVIEKLQNMDDRQRYMIFGGILVFIFLLDYFVLMKPQLNTLYKVNSDIKVVADQIKEAKENMTKKDFYIKEVEKLKESVEHSNEKVKLKAEVPYILAQVSLLADQNNVKIDQISPNLDAMEVILENNSKKYYALPIVIQARSNYHNFGRFINEIENSDIFFKVKSFTLSATDDIREHKVLLTLHAIVFEQVEAAATP